MKKLVAMLALAATFVLAGCPRDNQQPVEPNPVFEAVAPVDMGFIVPDVRLVVLHKSDIYTLLYGKKGTVLNSYCAWGNWKIVEDVPAGDPMWAKVIVKDTPDTIELHIHDVRDLVAGETQHGKTSAKSQVIAR